MPCVKENPRIIECSAANTHAPAASCIDHMLRCLRRGDVAIADHRNGLYGFYDGTNSVQVDSPAKTLLPGASVHEDRGHPDVFQCPREFRRCEVLIVPAEPHLCSDRNLDR